MSKQGRIIDKEAREAVLRATQKLQEDLDDLKQKIKSETKKIAFLSQETWEELERELQEALNGEDFLRVVNLLRPDEEERKDLKEALTDLNDVLQKLKKLRQERMSQMYKAQAKYDQLVTGAARMRHRVFGTEREEWAFATQRDELKLQMEKIEKQQKVIDRLTPTNGVWSNFEEAFKVVEKYQSMEPKYLEELPPNAEKQLQQLYDTYRQNVRTIILNADPHDKRLQTIFLRLPPEASDLIIVRDLLSFITPFLSTTKPLDNASAAISRLLQALVNHDERGWKEAQRVAPKLTHSIKFPTTDENVIRVKHQLLDITQEDLLSQSTLRVDDFVDMRKKKVPLEQIGAKLDYSSLTNLSSNGQLQLVLDCWPYVQRSEQIKYLDCIQYPRSKSVFPLFLSKTMYQRIPRWLALTAQDVMRSNASLNPEVLAEQRLRGSNGRNIQRATNTVKEFDYLEFLDDWQHHVMDWLPSLQEQWQSVLSAPLPSPLQITQVRNEQKAFKDMLQQLKFKSSVPVALRDAIPLELRFASSFNDPWFQLDTPLQAAARKQTDLYRYWKEWSPEYESVENAAHALLAEWNKGLREIRAHLQDEKLPDFDRLSEMCEYNLIYHDDLQALWKRIPDQLKISIDPNHPWFRTAETPKQKRLREMYSEYKRLRERMVEQQEDSPMPEVNASVEVKFQFNLVDIIAALKFLRADKTEATQLALPEEDEKNPEAKLRDEKMIRWSIRVAEAIRDSILGAERNGVSGIRADRNLRVPFSLLKDLSNLPPTPRNVIVMELASEIHDQVESPWTLLRVGRWNHFRARVEEAGVEPYIGARLPTIVSIGDQAMEAMKTLVKEYKKAPDPLVWSKYFSELKPRDGVDRSERFNAADRDTLMLLIRLLLDQKEQWDFEWFEDLQYFLQDIISQNNYFREVVIEQVFPEGWQRKKPEESPFAGLLRSLKTAVSKNLMIRVTEKYQRELRTASPARRADITLLFNQMELARTISNLRDTEAKLTSMLSDSKAPHLNGQSPEELAKVRQRLAELSYDVGLSENQSLEELAAERDKVRQRLAELSEEAKVIYGTVDNLPLMKLRERVDVFMNNLLSNKSRLVQLLAYWDQRPNRARPPGNQGYLHQRIEELADIMETKDEAMFFSPFPLSDIVQEARLIRFEAVARQFWTQFKETVSTATADSITVVLENLVNDRPKLAQAHAYREYAPTFAQLIPEVRTPVLDYLDKIGMLKINYKQHKDVFPWIQFWDSFDADIQLEMVSIRVYCDLSPDLDATAHLRYYALQNLFATVMMRGIFAHRITEFVHIAIGHPYAQAKVMQIADLLPMPPEFKGVYLPQGHSIPISEQCRRVISKTKFPEAFGFKADIDTLIQAIQNNDYYGYQNIQSFMKQSALIEFSKGTYYHRYKNHFLNGSCFYFLYDAKQPAPMYRPQKEEVKDVLENWESVPLEAIAYVCRYGATVDAPSNIPRQGNGRAFVVLGLIGSKGEKRYLDDFKVTIEKKQLHLLEVGGKLLEYQADIDKYTKMLTDHGPVLTWVSKPLYGRGTEAPCMEEVAWTMHPIEEITRLLY